jgi:predicted 3-demethylubiquinone-9 3-methyltransferase (glyoxalase superfamily)
MKITSNQKVTAFIMFYGQAEEAMNFYKSVFPDSEIVHLTHNEDGSVLHATFTVKGVEIMCIDSNIDHGFTLTPAMSLFVTCDSSEEIEKVYHQLAEGGQIRMPLSEEYPFSKKFGWVEDKFGVNWQLNLIA